MKSNGKGGWKVAKFGGTSLADGRRIAKVVDIIKSDPKRRFIIVSAPGKRHAEDEKVTDMFAHWARASTEEQASILELIYRRFKSIAVQLKLEIDIDALFDQIKKDGGALKHSENRFYYFALSRGEWLNAHIMAAATGFTFVDAAEFITFNTRGVYDATATAERAAALKLSHKARGGVVIPGFYGATSGAKRSIQIFPRGGSDITGAIVASLVGAAEYENWTDVLGIRMADPRIVRRAKKIAIMTYRELRELSSMGANVFHEHAVAPVRAVGIPIHVRATSAPQKMGTRIVTGISKPHDVITGIAGKSGYSMVTLLKYGMNDEVGFLWHALGVFRHLKINVDHCPGTVDSVSFVVHASELDGKREQLIEKLQDACSPDAIRFRAHLALICTVGLGLADTPGMAGKLCSALGSKGINIEILNQGGSEINIVVGVKEEERETAIRTIYDAFVG